MRSGYGVHVGLATGRVTLGRQRPSRGAAALATPPTRHGAPLGLRVIRSLVASLDVANRVRDASTGGTRIGIQE